jgi:hypothetical protein
VRTLSVGLQHGLECSGEAGKVTVVDAPVVQLAGKLDEELRPVAPGRFEGDADLDVSFHHLDCSSFGGRGASLFPGSVSAGGRTPLGDRSPASRSDRPTAPTTGRRGDPSRATVYFGVGRVRECLLGRCQLDVLASLPFAFPPRRPVFRLPLFPMPKTMQTILQQLVTTSQETGDA